MQAAIVTGFSPAVDSQRSCVLLFIVITTFRFILFHFLVFRYYLLKDYFLFSISFVSLFTFPLSFLFVSLICLPAIRLSFLPFLSVLDLVPLLLFYAIYVDFCVVPSGLLISFVHPPGSVLK